jgi:hypothetical protein
MAKDLWLFLVAVASEWLVLMTCAIVSMAFMLWQRYKKQETPSWLWRSTVVVTLFLALFGAWRKEHVQLIEERQRQIAVSVDKVMAGDVADGARLKATLVLFLKVVNSGRPSIAESYRLRSQVIGLDIGTLAITKPFPLSFDNNFPTLVLNPNEMLYQKTVKPIIEGGMERGPLLFQIQDREISEIKNADLEISLTDVKGIKHSFVFNLSKMPSDQTGKQQYYYPVPDN